LKFLLVLIEWEDSQQPISGWAYISDLKTPDALRVKSVGYLIQSNKRVKVLAPNLAGDSGGDAQVSGAIRIPARCVVKVTPIRLPP
jgi:hypothetical protein